MGAHNLEQKHPNRYTRPGIADSRCVPSYLGLFRREWEKKLTATGFDMFVLLSMRRWKGRGRGLDLLCDMWSTQLSIFGPASYERKSWG